MGLFSKKKKKKKVKEKESSELPDLPPLPDKFDFSDSGLKDYSEEMKNELPAFPYSETGEKMSNEAVKHALEKPGKVGEDTKPRTREIEDIENQGIDREISELIPNPRKINRTITQNRKADKEKGPIFVRIDKYEDALSSFQDIKKRLLDIEKDFKDIRETKRREENELQGWEGEIQNAKAKLDKIDKNIFHELE